MAAADTREYNMSLTSVVALQWKGEETSDIQELVKMLPDLRLTRKQNTLRVRYDGHATDVPIGHFLVVPFNNVANTFALSQNIFRKCATPIGKFKYSLLFKQVKAIPVFTGGLTQALENLKQVDHNSLVDVKTNTLSTFNRLFELQPDSWLVINKDFVFTLHADFVKWLFDDEYIREGDTILQNSSSVIIEGANVIIIRNPTTIIIDSAQRCQVIKDDLGTKTDAQIIREYAKSLSDAKESHRGPALGGTPVVNGLSGLSEAISKSPKKDPLPVSDTDPQMGPIAPEGITSGIGAPSGDFAIRRSKAPMPVTTNIMGYHLPVLPNGVSTDTIMRYVRLHTQDMRIRETPENYEIVCSYIAECIKKLIEVGQKSKKDRIVTSISMNKFEPKVTYIKSLQLVSIE